MKEAIALPQLLGTGFLTEVAVGALVSRTFETGPKVERADIIASAAVGAGFFRVGELHGSRVVRLQQHLDQCVGAPLFAEPFLISHKKDHEAREQSSGYSNKSMVSRCDQPQLIIDRLEE